MAIKIETIPLPDYVTKPTRATSEHGQALEVMLPGQSFAIPSGLNVQAMRVLAIRYGKKRGAKFSVRDGRVWRIS